MPFTAKATRSPIGRSMSRSSACAGNSARAVTILKPYAGSVIASRNWNKQIANNTVRLRNQRFPAHWFAYAQKTPYLANLPPLSADHGDCPDDGHLGLFAIAGPLL